MAYFRERETFGIALPELSTRKDHTLMPLDERLLRMPEDLVRREKDSNESLQNASVGTKRAASHLDLTDRGKRNRGKGVTNILKRGLSE
jgi:hypothetical protein